MSRIYLRALEPDDYQVTIKWRSDEEIQNMVGGAKYFVSSEKEKEWVRSAIFDKERMVLGICLKENNKLIGTVNIQEFDWINRSCHVPILIGDKDEWSKGYATEARMMALKFAFYERGMNRVWATILDNNMPSVKMHEKCGYKQEGVLRQSVYKDGAFHDQIVMSILKEEFDVVYQVYQKKYQ